MFFAFEQADSSTTRNFGGTGLGLAITRRLLDMMDSEIELESNEGEGSCFSFVLTFDKAIIMQENSEEKNDIMRLSSLYGKNILLVEDNLTNQLVVQGILEDSGVAIEIANNGAEAVELFAPNKYDLILMDIQMPIMGGIEATRIIRQKDSSIPVIALTAAVMQNEINAAKEVGMDAHIAKPIDHKELLQTISNLIN